MQIDICYDKSRLEFLERKNNANLCFAMQATEAKKPFMGLKHLVKAILLKNYTIALSQKLFLLIKNIQILNTPRSQFRRR